MEKSPLRMVGEGLLQRVAKCLYLNPAARSKNRWVSEEIAKALHPGHLSYVVLESILFEYRAISQIPISRLKFMMTGEKCNYRDSLRHHRIHAHQAQKRGHYQEHDPGQRPATLHRAPAGAVRDLLRVKRNANTIDLGI
jgi:hypothetical protein